MRIVITIFAEHAWAVETEPGAARVEARAGLARQQDDVDLIAQSPSPRSWTPGEAAGAIARESPDVSVPA